MVVASVPCALCTYCDISDLRFGLVHDADVDTALAGVLRQGMRQPWIYLPVIVRR